MTRLTFIKSAVNLLAIFALVVAYDCGRSVRAATFQGIPGLVHAAAVSTNGKYVVGGNARWSSDTGLLKLPDTAYGARWTDAVGVSADGKTVAGNGVLPAEGRFGDPAIIWADGQTYSHFYGQADDLSIWRRRATAVSDSGAYVVGADLGERQPVTGAAYWGASRRAGVYMGDSFKAGPPDAAIATDISADGGTIVGLTNNDVPFVDRFGGYIGAFPNFSGTAYNVKISPDGKYSTGGASSSNAFLHSLDDNTRLDFSVPGATFTNGHAVSDNRRVVGSSSTGPFYWDDGLVDPIPMKDYLMNQPGLATSLAGWTLTSANDISADGRTIVGTGINPQGQQQGWVADLTKHVVLNFGKAAPGNYEVVQGPQNKPTLIFNKNLPKLGALPAPPISAQEQIIEAVQRIFDSSGIRNIEVTTDASSDGVQVYFPFDSPVLASIRPYGHSPTDYVNVFDPTRTTPGINRFAAASTGDVLVFQRAFNQPQKGGLEFVAETIAHEVGHALGLMHLDGDGGPGVTTEVMDYNDAPGDHEVFTNKVTGIVNYATGKTSSKTQNAAYHLRRYVDGVPEDALRGATTPVLPGDFDEYKAITVDSKNYRLTGSDAPLFDAQLFFSSPASGGEIYQLAATSQETTASAINAMLSELPLGFSIRLLASSIDGGAADVAVSRYVDGMVEDMTVPLTDTPQHFALVKYSLIDQSYEVLGVGELSSVPEPNALIMVGVCLAGCAAVRTRRFFG